MPKATMMKCLARTMVAGLLLVSISRVWAHEGHDHAATQTQMIDPTLLGFSGLHEVFNVHPAFVHFPIALFPSALLLYGLGILLKRPSWIIAGRACLYLAAIGTAVAIGTGWDAQDTFPHNDRIHHMMMTHLRLGIMVGGLAVVLVMWSFVHRAQRPQGAYAFLAVLAFTTALVLQNGDLGSRMVYVEGAAVKPAISVVAGPHGQPHGESEYEPRSMGSDHQETEGPP